MLIVGLLFSLILFVAVTKEEEPVTYDTPGRLRTFHFRRIAELATYFISAPDVTMVTTDAQHCATSCGEHECTHYSLRSGRRGLVCRVYLHGHSLLQRARSQASSVPNALVHYESANPFVVGGSLGVLQNTTDISAYIFFTLRFPRPGRLVRWKYRAVALARFVATVWRPLANNFQLVAKNSILPSAIGCQVAVVSSAEQIHVRAGDVIGLQYPSASWDSGGVIPFDQEGHGGLCCDLTADNLPPVFSVIAPDKALFVGLQMATFETSKKHPALQAVVIQ